MIGYFEHIKPSVYYDLYMDYYDYTLRLFISNSIEKYDDPDKKDIRELL